MSCLKMTILPKRKMVAVADKCVKGPSWAPYIGVNMNIYNAAQAKEAGKSGIAYDEAIRLIKEFKIFNPYHILPVNQARKYLNQHWEGRLLDLRHFGLTPRKRPDKGKRGEKKDK